MTAADWERVSAALDRGGLVVLPSDTVYGLACLASLPTAVERIYHVKERQKDKPLALVFTSVEQIIDLNPELPEAIAGVLTKLLPGPVTAVVPFIEGSGGIHVHGGGSIGVRIVPPPAGDIYKKLPGPLAVTSANLSGDPEPGLAGEIQPSVVEACEIVVDGGDCEHRRPSTVVDLRPLEDEGSPEILRQGAMTAEKIRERLNR